MADLAIHLGDADWLTAPATQMVFALLGGSAEVRVVGGAVRNHLQGQRVNDIDFATIHSAEETMRRAQQAGIKAVATGVSHGTVTLVVREGDTKHTFEVTTLRIDVETDGRHAVVAPTKDWALDAARRDFTMNALYCDEIGKLFDYVDGYADVMARRVRFIGAASQRIEEDYLRILRFFRFSAIYAEGVLEAEGLAACIAGRDGIAQLSAERIKQELLKILMAPYALGILQKMAGVEILALILPGDVNVAGLGRLAAVEKLVNVPAQAILRLAALVADATVPQSILWSQTLKLSKRQGDRLCALTTGVGEFSPLPDEGGARRLLYKMGDELYAQCVLLAWAFGAEGHDAEWQELYNLNEQWPVPIFPLRGADVMALGMSPGPQIGMALKRLEREWIDAGFSWDEEGLRVRLKVMLPD